MAPMTITAADSRPYKIRVRIPIVGLTTFVDLIAIDSGLRNAERDALDSPKARAVLVAQSITVNLALIGLVLAVVGAFRAGPDGGLGLIASIVTGLVCLAVGIPAKLLMCRRGQRIKTLTRQLRARSDLHFNDEYVFRADLDRVDAVLRTMHLRGDTSLDGQAREAVRQLMQKYDREPTASQLSIARSGANDNATEAVRAAVKQRTGLVSEAVARAELAITVLEAAASAAGRR